MRAVTAGVSEACAEMTGLDHSQRGNDKHLGFTRGVWKPRWLDKSRPLDTVKAPGHQLVSADQIKHLMGPLGNSVAEARIPGQEPGSEGDPCPAIEVWQ